MTPALEDKRQELRNTLPALGARVFALHGKPYSGCGFHYALERQLGILLAKLNDFDKVLSDETLLNLEGLYEDLEEHVTEIEARIAGEPKCS